MFDIFLMFILCLILLSVLFKRITVIKVHKIKQIKDVKIENNIIDEELRSIDQNEFIKFASESVTKIWHAFHTGDINNIKTLIDQSILNNIRAKIETFPSRDKLINQKSCEIKSIQKKDDHFCIDVTIINEIQSNTRTYDTFEHWSFTKQKDQSDWIVNYISVF